MNKVEKKEILILNRNWSGFTYVLQEAFSKAGYIPHYLDSYSSSSTDKEQLEIFLSDISELSGIFIDVLGRDKTLVNDDSMETYCKLQNKFPEATMVITNHQPEITRKIIKYLEAKEMEIPFIIDMPDDGASIVRKFTQALAEEIPRGMVKKDKLEDKKETVLKLPEKQIIQLIQHLDSLEAVVEIMKDSGWSMSVCEAGLKNKKPAQILLILETTQWQINVCITALETLDFKVIRDTELSNFAQLLNIIFLDRQYAIEQIVLRIIKEAGYDEQVIKSAIVSLIKNKKESPLMLTCDGSCECGDCD